MEELLLLTMSDVERGIYDRSVNELERRQLCCHLQIATRLQHVVGVQQKSLDEVRVALIDHTQKVCIVIAQLSFILLLVCYVAV